MALPSLGKLRELHTELESLGQHESAKRLALVVEHYARLASMLELQAMPELEHQLETELEAHVCKTSETLTELRSTPPQPAGPTSLQALREEIDSRIAEESESLSAQLDELRSQVKAMQEEEQASAHPTPAYEETAAQMAAWRAELDESIQTLSQALEQDRKTLATLVEEAKTLGNRIDTLESTLSQPPPKRWGLFRRREPSEKL